MIERWFVPLAVVAATMMGALVVRAPMLPIAGIAFIVILAALARWPLLMWATVLLVSLFFDHFARTKALISPGGFQLYSTDLLLWALIAAATLRGTVRTALPGPARWLLALACAFIGLIGIDFARSLQISGLSGAVQVRHLVPFVLVVVLPMTEAFRSVSSRAIAQLISVVMIALAMYSSVRLLTGFVATPSLEGVQRIYQTWQPFVAAALGLLLLAYILTAPRVSVLNYAGLFASLVPVAFSFFRTAWVITAVLAFLVVIAVHAEPDRRTRLTVVLGCALGLALISQIVSSTQAGYEQQLIMRFHQITPQLDSYRVREYSAVWTQIRSNMLFGSGFGTGYIGDWTIYNTFCHNAYQWMWWRLGLVGALVFVGLIGAVFATVRDVARQSAGYDRALALGIGAAVLFTALAANLHMNFENYQTNVVIAMLLAQLLVLAQRGWRSGGE